MFEVQASEQVKLVARLHERHKDKAWNTREWFEEKGFEETLTFEIFRVSENSEILVGETSFSPFPGCCGIVVSHNTFLTERTRHSGLSNSFRKLKEHIARETGYTKMIATTQMSNIPAVGNFFKSRYRFVETFVNKRTNNLLGIGIKTL